MSPHGRDRRRLVVLVLALVVGMVLLFLCADALPRELRRGW